MYGIDWMKRTPSDSATMSKPNVADDPNVAAIHAQLDVLEATRDGGKFSSEPPAATTFFTELSKRVEATDSLLCVGLDPHAADIGEGAHATLHPPFLTRVVTLFS